MSRRDLTPKDILESKKKFPLADLMKADLNKMGSSKDSSTYYIDIFFKHPSGDYVPVIVRFKQILSAGKPKPPQKSRTCDQPETLQTDPKTRIKLCDHLQITFRRFKFEELAASEYTEKNKKVLIENINEMLDAMDVLDEAYVYLVKNTIFTYDAINFSKNQKINRFKQDDRKANEDDIAKNSKVSADEKFIVKGQVKLDIPLYRFRLGIDKSEITPRKIGYYNSKLQKFVYTVFDLRKPYKDASGANQFQKAKVTSMKVINGTKKEVQVDLDEINAKNFITYFSVISGVLNLSQMNVSQQGPSIPVKFSVMYICPHKKLASNLMSVEDLEDMKTITTSGYTDAYEPNEDDNDNQKKANESGDESDRAEMSDEEEKTKKKSKDKDKKDRTSKSKDKSKSKDRKDRNKKSKKVESSEDEASENGSEASEDEASDEEEETTKIETIKVETTKEDKKKGKKDKNELIEPPIEAVVEKIKEAVKVVNDEPEPNPSIEKPKRTRKSRQ